MNGEGRGRITTAKPEGCSIQKVKDLLNTTSSGWNEELLLQLFSADEVQAILRIPVSSLGLADRLVWHASNNGQYSVRTGYTVARALKKREAGDEGSSSRAEKEDAWSSVAANLDNEC